MATHPFHELSQTFVSLCTCDYLLLFLSSFSHCSRRIVDWSLQLLRQCCPLLCQESGPPSLYTADDSECVHECGLRLWFMCWWDENTIVLPDIEGRVWQASVREKYIPTCTWCDQLSTGLCSLWLEWQLLISAKLSNTSHVLWTNRIWNCQLSYMEIQPCCR